MAAILATISSSPAYFYTEPRHGTPWQLQQLDVHRRALAAWRTISSEEQRQWNVYAPDVPSHRPPYDNDNHITGHNLFVSAYSRLKRSSDAKTAWTDVIRTEKMETDSFPAYQQGYVSGGVGFLDNIALRLPVGPIFRFSVRNRNFSGRNRKLWMNTISQVN